MAVIVPTYLSGYDGQVKVDAVVFDVMSWEGDHKVGTWDAAHGAYGHPERAQESLNGSFEAAWLFAGDPPDLDIGLIYPVQLISKAGKGYAFNALLVGVRNRCDAKGGIIYTCSFESQGAIAAVLPA